jgi:hypothetical protein
MNPMRVAENAHGAKSSAKQVNIQNVSSSFSVTSSKIPVIVDATSAWPCGDRTACAHSTLSMASSKQYSEILSDDEAVSREFRES